MTCIATTAPRIVLIVLGIVISGHAFGFDIDGYRSGMSLAEVQRHSSGQLSRLSDDGYMDMTHPLGPSFVFCDNKLYFYMVSRAGDFPAFNHILERETARLGQGAYTTTNNEGRSSLLRITWQDGDATMGLTLDALATSDLGVIQTWDAQEAVCQPQKR